MNDSQTLLVKGNLELMSLDVSHLIVSEGSRLIVNSTTNSVIGVTIQESAILIVKGDLSILTEINMEYGSRLLIHGDLCVSKLTCDFLCDIQTHSSLECLIISIGSCNSISINGNLMTNSVSVNSNSFIRVKGSLEAKDSLIANTNTRLEVSKTLKSKEMTLGMNVSVIAYGTLATVICISNDSCSIQAKNIVIGEKLILGNHTKLIINCYLVSGLLRIGFSSIVTIKDTMYVKKSIVLAANCILEINKCLLANEMVTENGCNIKFTDAILNVDSLIVKGTGIFGRCNFNVRKYLHVCDMTEILIKGDLEVKEGVTITNKSILRINGKLKASFIDTHASSITTNVLITTRSCVSNLGLSCHNSDVRINKDARVNGIKLTNKTSLFVSGTLDLKGPLTMQASTRNNDMQIINGELLDASVSIRASKLILSQGHSDMLIEGTINVTNTIEYDKPSEYLVSRLKETGKLIVSESPNNY